jgi:hypothetical protein
MVEMLNVLLRYLEMAAVTLAIPSKAVLNTAPSTSAQHIRLQV